MFNRNLLLLVRGIYAAGSKRIDSFKPSYLRTRHYSKDSSSSSSSSCDKTPCEPCQDEPEQELDYGCEPPKSQYPSCPLGCVEDEPARPPTSTGDVGCPPANCPAPVCAPKEKPPCTPVCAPTKPTDCPPKSGKVNFLRMLSMLVVLPAIIGLSIYVFMTREEIDRPPFVPYPFMRKPNFAGRKWPWNSNKSLFYNGRVNALYDGYEEEEEEGDGEGEAEDESEEAKAEEE